MAISQIKRKTTLVSARTTTGASAAVERPRTGVTAFQVTGTTSAGSGSVTIKLQGSNNKAQSSWNDVATLTVTLGTTAASQEANLKPAQPYRYYRTNTTAISGTNASANGYMGVR